MIYTHLGGDFQSGGKTFQLEMYAHVHVDAGDSDCIIAMEMNRWYF